MGARELVFDIFAIDRASAVFRRVAGEAEGSASTVATAGRIVAGALVGTGIVLAGVAYESLKVSGEMQTAMGRLVSTAGETKSGVQVVWSGIDALAGQVGFSVTQLGEAMYYVEGGGFHAADAMTVLAAAAKGAKVEQADLTEVAHTVTGAMRDYGLGADQAANVTNAMTTAVGHGMMSFNDLAEAFPHVGARAKAANVTLNETLSAIARMTADGLPASVAATYLGQTIGQLAAPSAKARTEMQGLGIDSTKLAQTLTSGSGHGLGDAITMLYKGITEHLAPSGLVAVETFRKSKGAATDFQKMLANLPPAMQTSVQALATMGGGVKSFQGLVMLGQDGLKGYNGTLKDVNASTSKGSQTIHGFAEQQATLNGKIGDLKGAFSALADKIGRQLLPYATLFVGWLVDVAKWIEAKALPAISNLAGHIRDGLVTAFKNVNKWIADHKVLLQQIATYITGTVIPKIKDFASNIKDGLVAAFHIVSDAISAHKDTLESLGKVLLAVGGFIIQYVVPAIGVTLKYAFEVVGISIGLVINVISALVDAFKAVASAATWLWNSVLEPVLAFMLRGFADVTRGIGDMLAALGHIPGFGWAADAATALFGMAQKADDAATALDSIHSPPPIVITADASQVYGTLANIQHAAQTGININAKMAAMPGHATGTMNFTGGLTTINERGPEVVQLPGGTQIFTADQSKKMTGGHGNGPLVWIENYHEEGNSSDAVAADLMFRLRSA